MKTRITLVAFFLGLCTFSYSYGQLRKAKTFVYAEDEGSSSVSAFAVQSDGSLKELTDLGSPFSTGGFGEAGGCVYMNHIALARDFLFTGNDGSGDISSFSIDPMTGALKLVTDPPVQSGLAQYAAQKCGIALAATPDGRFLYATSFIPEQMSIVAFRIKPSGELEAIPGPGQSLPGGAVNLIVSPNGEFLAAVGTEKGSSVVLFSIGSEGELTQVSQPFSFGGAVASASFNCASNLLFIPLGGLSSGEVAVLEVAPDGTLTKITHSPFTYNTGGGYAAVPILSPDDLHLFVINGWDGIAATPSIASLNVLPGGGGSVTQTNPLISVARYPLGGATNQQGNFLYVAFAGFLNDYSVDLTTGALKSLGPTPLPAGYVSIAVFPPKTCFGNLAAMQAQTDDGGLYGLGGKGFDYGSTPDRCSFGAQTKAPCWINPSAINDTDNGYEYYASNSGNASPSGGPAAATKCTGIGTTPCLDLDDKQEKLLYDSTTGKYDLAQEHRDFGLDCSGLIMWSYNTVVEATTEASGNPAASTLLPIWYEGAGKSGQCSTAQSTFLTKDLSVAPGSTYRAPLDLRPGDLLCFTYHPGGGHVAMYLGSEAGQPGKNTIEDYTRSSIPDHNGVVLGNVNTRPFRDVAGFTNCSSSSPTTPCFDFDGFWRPREPRVAILFEAHSPVSLTVTDPNGSTITPHTWVVTKHDAYREAGSLFYNDYSPGGDDMVFSPVLESGTYLVHVLPKPGAAVTDTYSLTVTVAGNTVTLAKNIPISEIPSLGYGVESDGTTITPFMPVAIDIKPGSSSNPINTRSKGTIPVAILSNSTFDAVSLINPDSLTFGRTGNEPSLAFCNTAGEDVNGDGLPDLVCHFYVQKTGFQPGNSQGVLRGLTSEAKMIRGTDSVRIISR